MDDHDTILGLEGAAYPRPTPRWSLRVDGAMLAPDADFARIAPFFSQMAMLTLGGACAVLGWVAQAAVETYGWLGPGEMLDGLGMAETTPGPLITGARFVRFTGAFRDPCAGSQAPPPSQEKAAGATP